MAEVVPEVPQIQTSEMLPASIVENLADTIPGLGDLNGIVEDISQRPFAYSAYRPN